MVGVFPSMSNVEYHSIDGISKSGLDLIAKCPALYKSRYIDGIAQEETAAMRVGSAAHMLVFQAEEFGLWFAVRPAVDGRTKEGKAIITRFVAENQGRTILSQDEHQQASAIRDAVFAHAGAKQLVEGGIAEQSFFAEGAGITRKVRPDYMVNGLLVDLKTTTDASDAAFSRTCWNYRYHVQSAYYLDTVEIVTGWRPEGFIFIAAEKGSGQVAVYVASQSMIEAGRLQYQHDLEVYRRCLKTGVWPGYNNGRAIEISLPHWAQR